MQNGLLWLDAATLASVSLNGDINLVDPTAAEPAGARKATLQGHQVGRSVRSAMVCRPLHWGLGRVSLLSH